MVSNYSFYSIPVYWFLALYPHAYAASIIKKSNNGKWNNHNPHSTSTSARYAKSVPADVYARYERAEAAHRNGMENAPYFIGALVVGNMAGLGAGTMNGVAAAALGLRALHGVLYINTTTQERSFLRSLTWLASTLLLIGVYVAAGNELKGR